MVKTMKEDTGFETTVELACCMRARVVWRVYHRARLK